MALQREQNRMKEAATRREEERASILRERESQIVAMKLQMKENSEMTNTATLKSHSLILFLCSFV